MQIIEITKYMLFCSILLTSLARAEVYYDEHATGWHWYDDPAVLSDAISKEGKPISADPIDQMKDVKTTITRALDRAVLNPTQENVANYITLQNQLSSKANQFAYQWQHVLLLQPELNYNLTHPTNQVATQVYADEQRKKEDNAIVQLAKESGLFFFYHSTCPYCQRFSPIVKTFSERYHVSVIPITTDGISLPEFPHSYHDNGQAKLFHVKVEPSLFAVNPYTQKAYPVSYGLISEAELRRRILDIATHFKGVTS